MRAAFRNGPTARRILDAVRRNHALEHATVAVLLGKLGPGTRLVARSTADGFYIFGDVPTQRLEESVTEALARLKQGESHLAISPLCGTNLAVAGILAGLASILVMGGSSRWDRTPSVLMSAMLAVLAAQPLGRLAQKYVTTSPDVAQMQVVAVHRGGWGPGIYHKVVTRQAAA